MSSEQTVNKARKNVEQVCGMYYNDVGDYMDTKQYSNQVKLKNIKINDSFWSNIQSKISQNTKQKDALFDDCILRYHYCCNSSAQYFPA